ncbi:MAG: S-layer homology domain-containing protein [Clostridia bacterium]|nr:S-layer homology domain-containing protein [Clostridia bacterium]
MKKIIVLMLAVAMLITGCVTVAADPEYTLSEKRDEIFLRSDGTVYCIGNYGPELLEKGIADAYYRGSYMPQNFKEELKEKNTMVALEDARDGYSAGMNWYDTSNVVYEIPDLKYLLASEVYATADGDVFNLVIFDNNGQHLLNCIGNVGRIKEISPFDSGSCVLNEAGELYSVSRYNIEKISDDVIDFKNSDYDIYFRTSDNSLYTIDNENGMNEKLLLLADCSATYTKGFAKGNNGKWYHRGDNNYFQLEPEKRIDGNNITQPKFKTMVEATDYVYRPGSYSGAYEWNKDGNLYFYDGDVRTLVAQNIIYMDTSSAATADGDLFVISGGKHVERKIYDYNIKNPEKYLELTSYDLYVNTEEGISGFIMTKAGKTAFTKIRLGEKYPDRSDWAQPEIEMADQTGYIDSVKLLPMQGDITREDFCNMIVDFCEIYLGRELSAVDNPFTDTENPKVVKAYASGIIAGVSYDEFQPREEITREQMCAIMTRAAKFLKADIQFGQPIAFNDMDRVSDWAVEGVNAMSGLGIVKGDGVTINPGSFTSVEQAIAMTYRLYNIIK